MRKILCFLAMLTMSQPVLACGMDGLFGAGAHRFNPFLAMQTGSGDQSYDQGSDLSDDQDDYADSDYETQGDEPELETAEYDPGDL